MSHLRGIRGKGKDILYKVSNWSWGPQVMGIMSQVYQYIPFLYKIVTVGNLKAWYIEHRHTLSKSPLGIFVH